MLIRSRIRGPKLGIKLMLLGIVLMVVPWLSYIQLIEMERLLIQGQQNAQLLMAQGISTLFNSRDDLFSDLPIHLDEYDSLFVYPLEGSTRIDGTIDDWIPNTSVVYRDFSLEGDDDGSFSVALGERDDDLYIHMRIHDDALVYRDPTLLSLNRADHIRITYQAGDEQTDRLSLSFSEPGILTTYHMQSDWATPMDWSPEIDALGFVRETDEGLAIEYRMPLSMVKDNHGFSIGYADVDNSDTRNVRALVETLPEHEQEGMNLVVFRSAETMNLIERLGFVDSRVTVYDSQQNVRADSDVFSRTLTNVEDDTSALSIGFRWLRPYLHRFVVGETWTEMSEAESQELKSNALKEAIAGNPQAIRRLSDTGSPILLAVHPIRSSESIIGAVVVEQDISEILSYQQAALQRIVLVSLVALAIVLFIAAGFAIRLAYRIRKLRRETSGLIDTYGRLTSDSLNSEVNAGDEIGDLARAIDNMLARLHEHNSFLQRMPRTLRHEINNPLNTLRTSLDTLKTIEDKEQRVQYLESAERGLLRIGAIVQNLAEAANLEESLSQEEKAVVDIEQFLENYVGNINLNYGEGSVIYRGLNEPLHAFLSDMYIEQMMDKLIDNAMDFRKSNSPIRVQLDRSSSHLRISVANQGPSIDTDPRLLFERLVSHRKEQGKLHFGLGLYVVRLITEYHDGEVRAVNLPNETGVVVSVEIPIGLDPDTREPILEKAA